MDCMKPRMVWLGPCERACADFDRPVLIEHMRQLIVAHRHGSERPIAPALRASR